MKKPAIVGIYGLTALLIIVGAYVRLDVTHANTASFVTFLTNLAPIVPALAAWIAGRRAHSTAQTAVDKADTAATAAVAAESNTNGKMAAQFSLVHNEVTDLKTAVTTLTDQFTAHLTDHGQQ